MVSEAAAAAVSVAPRDDRGARGFAQPGLVRQGWYLLWPQRRLARGAVRAVTAGTRRVVVYRDLAGVAHVVDDRCPHLGSDLALDVRQYVSIGLHRERHLRMAEHVADVSRAHALRQ